MWDMLVVRTLLCGAVLGLICSSVVIWSYCSLPIYRRHPNSLLLWKSVCSFGLALKVSYYFRQWMRKRSWYVASAPR